VPKRKTSKRFEETLTVHQERSAQSAAGFKYSARQNLNALCDLAKNLYLEDDVAPRVHLRRL